MMSVSCTVRSRCTYVRSFRLYIFYTGVHQGCGTYESEHFYAYVVSGNMVEYTSLYYIKSDMWIFFYRYIYFLNLELHFKSVKKKLLRERLINYCQFTHARHYHFING